MHVKSILFFCMVAMTGCATSVSTGPTNDGGIFDGRTALPDLTAFSLLHTNGGSIPARIVSLEQAADMLLGYDVIFIGESHRHPGNHLAQMQLFRAIHERARNVSLSMEQFERDVQTVVDAYLAGQIGEGPFIETARAWGNYRTSYRPLVEYAKEHGLTVIASNAPEKVVRCVGIEGEIFLKRLKPAQRTWAAESLDLRAGAYRDKFMDFVQGDAAHGGDPDAAEEGEAKLPSEGALRSYAAQITRDDTMAEYIVQHLAAHPDQKIVHLNGSFHSDSFLGTVERVKARRPNAKIAVISPTTVEAGTDVTLSDEDLTSGTFVLLLRELPDAYASDEEMNAAIKRQMGAREERACEL